MPVLSPTADKCVSEFNDILKTSAQWPIRRCDNSDSLTLTLTRLTLTINPNFFAQAMFATGYKYTANDVPCLMLSVICNVVKNADSAFAQVHCAYAEKWSVQFSQTAPIMWASATSSTQPEVHNVLHCCRSKAEPRYSRAICTQNFAKLEWFLRYAVGQIGISPYRHMHRYTDTSIAIHCMPLSGRSKDENVQYT